LGFPKGGYVSKKYQSWEEQIAPLVSNIQTRGYVTFYELMKIGAWKAARPLAYLTLNVLEITVKEVDERLMQMGMDVDKDVERI
jgi:hypothetical protein